MYQTEIVNIIDEAINTKIFRLKLPENFFYKPGQFIRIKFDPNLIISYAEERFKNGEIDEKILEQIKIRAKKNFREFSITNPYNGEYIELLIEKSETGGFSPWIYDNAKVGEKIEIDGPYGKFILDENEKYVCFLAAGSGIAPIMCHIRYSIEKKLNQKLLLIYSNKTLNHISYKDELERLEKENPEKLFVVHTLTRLSEEEKKNWEGYTKRIDAEMIKECLSEFNFPIEETSFYICGGPEFVKSMKENLLNIGIKSEKIKMELY